MTKRCFSCGEQFVGKGDVCASCQYETAKLNMIRVQTLPLSQLSDTEKRAKAEYIKHHIDEMATEYERLNPVHKYSRWILIPAKIFISFMFVAMFAPFFAWLVGML